MELDDQELVGGIERVAEFSSQLSRVLMSLGQGFKTLQVWADISRSDDINLLTLQFYLMELCPVYHSTFFQTSCNKTEDAVIDIRESLKKTRSKLGESDVYKNNTCPLYIV